MITINIASRICQPGKYGQWIAVLIVSMSSLTIGFVFSWPSGALPKIREEDTKVHLDLVEQSWVVSILYAGSLISPIPSAIMIDHLGRRNSIIVNIWLLIASFLIMATIDGFWPLIFARIIQGFWIGLIFAVVPVYVGECTDPSIRGILGTFYSIFLYSGSLIISFIGSYSSYVMLSLIPAMISVALAILHCLIPESPYYYIAKGDMASARESITWLRGHCDEYVLNSIQESIRNKQKQKSSFLDIIRIPATRKAFIIVTILGAVQRTSGLGILLNYTSVTLPDYFTTPEKFTIVLNVTWIVSSFISGFVMDKFGRRTLMGFSSTGSCLTMFGVATWFFLRDKVQTDVSSTMWLPFALLMTHGFFYSLGIVCIPTMMPGEVFSPEVKAKATSIVSVWVSIVNGIVLKVYLPLEYKVGIYSNYLICSVSGLIGLLTAIFLMIETRGRTLEEILDELEEHSKKDVESKK